ncbi:MAG: creatininase family protein [Planctomycetes bacterium]|nr:creatininase family protein [Planctomycetota bacterium]
MRPWKLQEMTYKQVRETPMDVALLPIGSTEAHNLHLPYGTDFYQVEAVSNLACERAASAGAKVVRLPGIPYGVESNLQAFKLTMHVRQATLDTLVGDLVRSLDRHGIRKLVLVNGHGGNNFQPCVRDLYGQTGVFIAVVDWWKMGQDSRETIFSKTGEHADEMETSNCLHLIPDLVHLEDADEGKVRRTRFEALNRGWAWIPRPWDRLTTQSGYGDPRQATAEKGQRFLDLIAGRLSQFLVELSESPMDGLFPYLPQPQKESDT